MVTLKAYKCKQRGVFLSQGLVSNVSPERAEMLLNNNVLQVLNEGDANKSTNSKLGLDTVYLIGAVPLLIPVDSIIKSNLELSDLRPYDFDLVDSGKLPTANKQKTAPSKKPKSAAESGSILADSD